MRRKLSVGVVALGSFNPAIFHPEWFRANDLLPEDEVSGAVEDAGRLMVSSQQTQVRFDSLDLLVMPDRWQLLTDREDWFEDIGSTVASVFRCLDHTPVSSAGFNRAGHYDVGARATDILRRWLPLDELASVAGEDARPGAILRAGWQEFALQLNLEPSVQLKPGTGIFVNQNYERRKLKTGRDLAELLDREWKLVLDRSESVVNKLLEE